MITVERFLRRTGDLDFRADTEPTGYFSASTRDAIRWAQRRNRRADTGRIAPDDDLLDVLTDEAAERERNDRCKQLEVRLANLQNAIDRQVERVEDANAAVVDLGKEAEELNFRHGLELVSILIPAAASAIRAIRLGRGIIGALREFARSSGSESGQLSGAQEEALDLASRFELAVDELERRLDELNALSEEREQLVEERRRLGC